MVSRRIMSCFHVHNRWTTTGVLPILCGMDTNTAATSLEALGSPTRLEIFRLLVRAGPTGAVVGELQAHLNIPASTLSHHIAKLVRGGLVTQERQSRSLICRANYPHMVALLTYLQEHCCEGLQAGEGMAGCRNPWRVIPPAGECGQR